MGSGRKKGGTLPDPGEVLSGLRRADMAQLFHLIHQVNPTDKRLFEAERARHYALKNALQSLLIRQCGEHLSAHPDPSDPEIITLRDRATGRDAGHARIEALDSDARAWVHLQLTAPPAAPSRGRAPLPVEDAPVGALERGRAALSEYDFEQARSCFEVALAGGIPGAAAALLDLLIEHLGLDEEAAEIGRRLPPSAAEDVEVRALLGLAAARLGAQDRALRLLAGLQGARAASAWAALADGALAAGDAQAVERAVSQLREQDPSHPSIRSLEDRLASLGARARLPEEEEIRSLAAAGEWERAEGKAAELLRRWSQSEVASRILAEARRLREQKDRAERLQASEEAARRGAYPQAIAQLRPLRGDREIDARLLALERALAEETERLEIERVRALCRADLRAGRRAWLELPPSARAPLRAEIGEEIAGWMEGLRAELPREEGALIGEAVEALLAARAAAAREEPEQVAALLRASPLTRRLREARRLEELAGAELQRRREQALRARLEESAAALSRGDLRRAEELLAGLDHPEALSLGARVAALQKVAQREERYAALLGAGDRVGARNLAARLAAEGEGEEWAPRAEELSAAIRAEWRIRVVEGDALPPDLRENRMSIRVCGPNTWLAEGGEIAYLADSRDRWLVVREVSTALNRMRRVVMLRLPAPLGSTGICYVGGVLWILGNKRALSLSTETWDVLAWYDPPNADGGKRSFEISPDGVALLVHSPEGELTVLDAKTLEPVRFLGRCKGVRPVPGSDPPQFITEFEGRIDVHTTSPRYKEIGSFDISMVRGVAGSPFPERLTLLSGDSEEHRTEKEACIVEISFKGSVQVRSEIQDHRQYRPREKRSTNFRSNINDSIATASEQLARAGDRLFTLIHSWGGGEFLLDLQRRGQNWEQRGRVPIPPPGVLVGDPRGESAALVLFDQDGMRFYRLGGPLQLPATDASWREAFPKWAPPFQLSTTLWARKRFDEVTKQLGIARLSSPLDPTVEEDPEFWAIALLKLHAEGEIALAPQLQRALERHPDHSLLLLVAGWLKVEEGEWSAARSYLERYQKKDFRWGADPSLYRNLFLAVSLVHLGELRPALDLLRGAHVEHHKHYCAYLEALLGEPARGEQGVIPGGISWRVQQLLSSDQHLAGGDWRAAIQDLDHVVFWGTYAPQIDARRAAAWLKLEPSSPGEDLRRRIALAAAADSIRRRKPGEIEHIPLGSATWSEARLRELAAEAELWLEAHW